MEERHITALIEISANNVALRPASVVGSFEGNLLYFHAMHDKPADAPTSQGWQSAVPATSKPTRSRADITP